VLDPTSSTASRTPYLRPSGTFPPPMIPYGVLSSPLRAP
jgi:hypothetical protein